MAWTTPTTYTVGQLLTAGLMNQVSGDLNELPFQMDYASITLPQTGIVATTEGTATAVITGNSVTYTGSQVMVHVFSPDVRRTDAGTATAFTIVISRDSTIVGQIHGLTQASTTTSPFFNGVCFDTPSAAAHVYKASLFVAAGTMAFEAGAGGTGNLVPAFLRVTNAPLT